MSFLSRTKGKTDGPVSPADALKLLQSRSAPAGLRVRGRLEVSKAITELCAGLQVDTLAIPAKSKLAALPPDIRVRRVDLTGHEDPQRFLPGLHCQELFLKESQVTSLPADLRVENRLDLEEARHLEFLPDGLKVGVLILRGCSSLQALPEGLETSFLDISGCGAIENWPRQARVEVGRLTARGCRWITQLPPWLGTLAQLDLRDCSNLPVLPEGLRVTSWIDIAGTSVTALPESLRGIGLRWRGVPVEERVVLHPETITPQEVLSERNAERRRVLIERIGYDTFVQHAKAKVVDKDQDRGGERRLLRVELGEDEPLVCVSVFCPSTGRQYMIRVPPKTRTCREAVAWVAGFDNEADYQPIAET